MSVPFKDHTPSFYSFLLNRPPLLRILLSSYSMCFSSLIHIHANLLGTYSMPDTVPGMPGVPGVPGVAVSRGHSRTGPGPPQYFTF